MSIQNLEALIAEFESVTPKHKCCVCNSECRELIEVLKERGAGVTAIEKFVNDKFGADLSEDSIRHHFRRGHAESQTA